MSTTPFHPIDPVRNPVLVIRDARLLLVSAFEQTQSKRILTVVNKAEEFKVLEMVMMPKLLQRCSASECPDFIYVKSGASQLGIEITEMFANESDARLKRIPRYAMEILDRKAYRHKADKKNLPVETATYFPKGGTPRQLEGIFTYPPKLPERMKILNSTLLKKARKIADYRTKVAFVDLVIVDNGLFRHHRFDHLTKLLFDPETRANIQLSGFREVRLILDTFENKRAVMCCRLNIFAEEIFLLEKAFAELPSEDREQHGLNFFRVLVALLRKKGFPECCAKFRAGKIAICSEVANFVYSKTGKQLYDFEDFPNKDFEEDCETIEADDNHPLYAILASKTEKWNCTVNLVKEITTQKKMETTVAGAE